MEVAVMFQTSLFAVLTLITTPIGVQLPLMTALLLSGSSSQRWLLTRMPGKRRDLPRNSVMELTVGMDIAAMRQTTLFAVLMATFGAELLLMTALLLSRSSPQWLLTRDLTRKIVMVRIVEMAGVAMKVTTQSAAPREMMEPNGVLMMLMTALLLSRSSSQRWLLTRMTRNIVMEHPVLMHIMQNIAAIMHIYLSVVTIIMLDMGAVLIDTSCCL